MRVWLVIACGLCSIVAWCVKSCFCYNVCAFFVCVVVARDCVLLAWGYSVMNCVFCLLSLFVVVVACGARLLFVFGVLGLLLVYVRMSSVFVCLLLLLRV